MVTDEKVSPGSRLGGGVAILLHPPLSCCMGVALFRCSQEKRLWKVQGCSDRGIVRLVCCATAVRAQQTSPPMDPCSSILQSQGYHAAADRGPSLPGPKCPILIVSAERGHFCRKGSFLSKRVPGYAAFFPSIKDRELRGAAGRGPRPGEDAHVNARLRRKYRKSK